MPLLPGHVAPFAPRFCPAILRTIMSPQEGSNRYISVERFYGAVRNLNDVEQRDIRNVVMGVLNPTLREKYLTLNYQRAALNVELLLTLKDTGSSKQLVFWHERSSNLPSR